MKYIIYYDNESNQPIADQFEIDKIHKERWDEIKDKNKILVSAGYVYKQGNAVITMSGSESLKIKPNEHDQRFFETLYRKSR